MLATIVQENPLTGDRLDDIRRHGGVAAESPVFTKDIEIAQLSGVKHQAHHWPIGDDHRNLMVDGSGGNQKTGGWAEAKMVETH